MTTPDPYHVRTFGDVHWHPPTPEEQDRYCHEYTGTAGHPFISLPPGGITIAYLSGRDVSVCGASLNRAATHLIEHPLYDTCWIYTTDPDGTDRPLTDTELEDLYL